MEYKNKAKSEYTLWVDIFKGICILLMVMGHAGSPFTTYIYLFHMPAFILISGYTYSGNKYNFIEYVKKKFFSLLVPMFLINICYILFYILLQKLGYYSYFQASEQITFSNRLKLLFFNLGTPDFGGATWFLFVLYAIEIAFKGISVISNKVKIKNLDVLISLLFYFLGWKLISKNYILPYYIDLCMYGLCYFSIGVLLGRNKAIDEYIDLKVMTILSMIVVIFFGSFYFKGQLPMNWPTRQFASLPIQFISSMAGIFLCYIISRILELSMVLGNLLKFIGQRTYSILVLHFFAFRMIFGSCIILKILDIDYLRELTPRYSSGLQWLYITIISVILSLVISRIAQINIISNYIINAKQPFRRL